MTNWLGIDQCTSSQLDDYASSMESNGMRFPKQNRISYFCDWIFTSLLKCSWVFNCLMHDFFSVDNSEWIKNPMSYILVLCMRTFEERTTTKKKEEKKWWAGFSAIAIRKRRHDSGRFRLMHRKSNTKRNEMKSEWMRALKMAAAVIRACVSIQCETVRFDLIYFRLSWLKKVEL